MNDKQLGRCGDDYIVSFEEKLAYEKNGYITLRNVLTEAEIQKIEQDFHS